MNFLNRLKITSKLSVVLGLLALSLAITIALSASLLRQKMMADRLDKLHAVVETAYHMAESLEGDVANGRMTRDKALAEFRDRVDAMWYDQHHNYLLAATLDGVFIANGNNPKMEGTTGTRDASGKLIIFSFVDVVKNADEGTITFNYPKPGETDPSPKLSYIRKFAPWNMLLSSGVWIDDIETEYRALLLHFGLFGLLIFLAVGTIAFLITRNVASSLGNVKAKMAMLASGNLDVEVGEAVRNDEIGDIAKTLEVFKNNALAMRRLEQKQLETTRRAEQDRKTAFNSLAGSFEQRARGIVDVFSQSAVRMQSTARSMSQTADETRKQTVAVAAGATETTTNVHTVAVASEELSASIAEIGNQVSQAAGIAKKAASEAMRTNTNMATLADTAQKVGEVVQLINDIASQTNLLALNATIEAARAGEAGKGFAVVASEVKSLANQTAKATEDIRAQIGAIQDETTAAVSAIQNISKTILEVNEISSSIAAAVEQQTAATQEITRNVQQAAGGTENVSRNISGVSAAMDKAGDTANELLTAADALAQQSETLRREVDQFLATIRAA